MQNVLMCCRVVKKLCVDGWMCVSCGHHDIMQNVCVIKTLGRDPPQGTGAETDRQANLPALPVILRAIRQVRGSLRSCDRRNAL